MNLNRSCVWLHTKEKSVCLKKSFTKRASLCTCCDMFPVAFIEEMQIQIRLETFSHSDISFLKIL